MADTAHDWSDIRERLAAARNAVYDEIRHYPPPIPACDVQFNHLLAERARLSAAVRLMDGAAGDRERMAAATPALAAIIDETTTLDATTKSRLQLQLARMPGAARPASRGTV